MACVMVRCPAASAKSLERARYERCTFFFVSSSSSDEPNRFVFTIVDDDAFVARPAGGCVCRRRRRRRSGRSTHWDGHTVWRTHCLADVCMCKQYGLSHSGTHTCGTLGHTGTQAEKEIAKILQLHGNFLACYRTFSMNCPSLNSATPSRDHTPGAEFVLRCVVDFTPPGGDRPRTR